MSQQPPDTSRRAWSDPASAGDSITLSDAARDELERFRQSHETLVLSILFNDLVGSTQLQTERGNLRAAQLVQQHYGLLRTVLTRFDGREIKTAGDSMLIVFAAPSEAVKFALHAQRTLRERRQVEPDLLPMRVGVHQGQVVLETDRGRTGVTDVYGLQVSTAARIMSLAEGDQILLSRAVFDDARAILCAEDFPGFPPLAWCNHGLYRFQGVEDSHEVCEVGEEGAALLRPPAASAKAWPAERSTEELGWRPANGVVVPESNWLLTDKLGAGAFGEVWKAFNLSDKSFEVFKFCFKRDRLPALKREARLLKRLRKYAHPSIVEVYDVTERERPPHYLEMEYVEGPALRDWLATEPPLAERLEVVAQIAEALDTVHAAGIFHRDIKPANILLTRREDGALRAKLSDFGLGAAQDPEFLQSISASRVDGVVGTWDYIAPEVRQGGTASAQSDIYALGLTLYQIAVGDLDRPLTGDWEDQLPSEILRNDIRRCVCQTAGERWPRAATLAQALRSHDQRLHTQTLERQREEHRERARRLRRAVALTSLVATVLLVVSGFAVYQWYEAAWQRDRAVAQKRLALGAINKLTHDVPLRLQNIPGTLPITKQILEENLGMLDQILAMEPDTHFARRERSVNLIAMGDRWLLVGDTQRAAAAFAEGLAISGELAQSHPETPEYLRDLAIGWDRLGDVRLAMGQSGEALQAYRQSMDITRQLADRAPRNRLARRDVWLALDKLGLISLRLGSTEDAARYHKEALATAAALAEESPEDTAAQHDLGLCYHRIGDLHMMQGRHAAARDAYATAMDLIAKDAAAHPDDPRIQRVLSISYDKLGGADLKLGRTDDARQAYESSLRLVETLARKEPDNVQLQRDVAVALDRLGDVCMQSGRPAEALAQFEAGMVLGRKIAAQDPANSTAQFDLSAGLAKLGDACLALDRMDDALASFQEALENTRQLATADPDNTEVQRTLSVLLAKVGSAQLLTGQHGPATQSFTAAIDIAQRLAESDVHNVQAQRDVAVGWHRLMLAHQQTGNLDGWRAASQHTIEGFERVHEATSGAPASVQDLTRVLAQCCEGLGVFSAPSAADLQVALARARQLVTLSRGENPGYLETLAHLQFRTGDGPGAIASLEQALQHLPDNPDDPDAAATRQRLAAELEACRTSLPAPSSSPTDSATQKESKPR